MHTLTVTFDRVGYIPVIEAHCTFGSEAPCRRWCGVALYGVCRERPGMCGHPTRGGCLAVALMQQSSRDVETWLMGKTTSVTLPIEVDLRGEYGQEPVWRFADNAGVPRPALADATCDLIDAETARLPQYADRDLRCREPAGHLGAHLPRFEWAPAWGATDSNRSERVS
jgi:hypothetical protein